MVAIALLSGLLVLQQGSGSSVIPLVGYLLWVPSGCCQHFNKFISIGLSSKVSMQTWPGFLHCSTSRFHRR